MGLWTRMKRSMRALFGGVIERTEDPELILQQTIRDMRDRIPDLNNSVAQVMATEKLLAKNKERLETQVVDLDSKIKASVKMNRDNIDRRAAAAEARMQLGTASVDSQMQEIEKEAMDMQLQDKLLAYKREMGLLPEGSESAAPQALPAQGETTPQS